MANGITTIDGTENRLSFHTRKNLSKKQKKKQRKQQRRESESEVDEEGDDTDQQVASEDDTKASGAENLNVEVEYVPTLDFDVNDPKNAELVKIYERFQEYVVSANAASLTEEEEQQQQEQRQQLAKQKNEEEVSDEDEDEKEEGEGDGYVIGEDGQKISKKKMRKMKRMSIAELKQVARKPEVVEWVDVTAQDPALLVHLKSYRNTVPVPRHWSQKRKYLQNKRGIEKPPFDLPDFIKHTGITEMREAVREKEDKMKASQKAREKIQPKMGKLEIDYQKLHDAFFRFQTKPNMTSHGDVYYEGKEYEVHMKEKRPGQLSDELKAALAIPENAPPPWLINMQRYGPPPSYPGLRIAGLNAPIPPGCEWGFHPGGWGRPPVDDFGNPLYGDVYGYNAPAPMSELTIPIERNPWGEMLEEDYSSDEEEEKDEGQGDGGEASGTSAVGESTEDNEEPGLPKPTDVSGLVTPSGFTSTTTSGLETPDQIELRKDRRGDDTPSTVDHEHRPLYTILQQKDTKVSGFMGSSYTYDIAGGRPGKVSGDDIEIALDPSEMDTLDEAGLRAKYEQTVNEGSEERVDLSDMVAEHAAKTDKKRKSASSKGSDSKSKKYKDFKF